MKPRKKEGRRTNTRYIRAVVEAAGGADRMARHFNVTKSLVYQWCQGVKPVPLLKCIEIERLTEGQVTRYHLRPELFGEPKPVQILPSA